MFQVKTWLDRIVSYPGRRKLVNTMTGAEQTVDVSRDEGAVTQEGDAVNALNLNDLENRIQSAFEKVDSSVDGNQPLRLTTTLNAQSFSNTVIFQNENRVTSDMVVVESVLSNPSAQSNDWTIHTEDGVVKLSGTCTAQTSLTIVLQKCRT